MEIEINIICPQGQLNSTLKMIRCTSLRSSKQYINGKLQTPITNICQNPVCIVHYHNDSRKAIPSLKETECMST